MRSVYERSARDKIRMGLRKHGQNGYEEMPGKNLPHNPNRTDGMAPSTTSQSPPSLIGAMATPDFELGSVSVVPDGE